MNPSRAKALLALTTYGSLKYAFVGRKGVNVISSPNYHANGITEAEDKVIRAVWDKMGIHSSYRDALCAIAKGTKRKVTKLEIKDGGLHISYDNGDFVCAALDVELTADLLSANLNTIAPEVDPQYMAAKA